MSDDGGGEPCGGDETIDEWLRRVRARVETSGINVSAEEILVALREIRR